MKAPGKRGRRPHDDVLTKTEWSIVHAVQHGVTTREIAKQRGVSFDAVKFHVDNAKAKLGLTSRQSLRGWFQAPKQSALNVQTRKREDSLTLGQIARSVKNLQESVTWYRDVLKLPWLFTFGNMAFFKDLEARALAIMAYVNIAT